MNIMELLECYSFSLSLYDVHLALIILDCCLLNSHFSVGGSRQLNDRGWLKWNNIILHSELYQQHGRVQLQKKPDKLDTKVNARVQQTTVTVLKLGRDSNCLFTDMDLLIEIL
jgi:hypothetical protein